MSATLTKKPKKPAYGSLDYKIREQRIEYAIEHALDVCKGSIHALWLATEAPERMLPEDRDQLCKLLAAAQALTEN